MNNFENLEDLRVIDLKKELEKLGLPRSGTKKELIDRLKAHLDGSNILDNADDSQSDTVLSSHSAINNEEMEGYQNKSINDSVIEIVKNPDYSDDNTGDDADNENSLNESNFNAQKENIELHKKSDDVFNISNQDDSQMDLINDPDDNILTNSMHNVHEIQMDNNDDIIEKPIVEKIDGPDVYEQLRATSRKISLSDKHNDEVGKDAVGKDIAVMRKRRWAQTNTNKSTINIGSETLKSLVGEVVFEETANLQEEMMELAPEPTSHEFDDHKEPTERRKSGGLSRTIFQEINENEKPTESGDMDDDTVIVSNRVIVSRNSDDKNRRLLLDSMDAPIAVAQRSPSPPKKAITNYLHVHNLVRPFTLIQLKQLLGLTGTIVDDGFWIDKIKSHCIVVYATSEEAVETRKALHGKKWPLSNPKTLRVDFSTEEEFTMCKNSKETIGTITAPKKEENFNSRGNYMMDRSPSPQKQSDLREHVRNVLPMREWDRGKMRQSRSMSQDRQKRREAMDHMLHRKMPYKSELHGDHRSQEDRRRHQEGRSGDRKEDPSRENTNNSNREPSSREHRSKEQKENQDRKHRSEERKPRDSERHKQQIIEDEQPAKLLDDLFRKTKTTPCIYWLPLTEEQIREKEIIEKKLKAEKEKRLLEREKAMEEDRKIRELEREKRRLLREQADMERQARIELDRERRREERKKRHSSRSSR